MRGKSDLPGVWKSVFGDEIFHKLARFKDELVKWNKKFSLTSVPDDRILEILIAPSAWLGQEYAREKVGTVADFGCGPGIPGAVMAMADNSNRYTLFDSNEKKIGFLRHCLSKTEIMGASDVKAYKIRLTPESRIDQVDRLVTRAAGEMKDVIGLWKGKVRKGGVADFFKGEDAKEEIEALVEIYPAVRYQIMDTPSWFGKLQIIRITNVFDQ